MTHTFEQRRILILGMFLSPLIALGYDLYTPSLPAITSYFHVTHFAANLTIIFYIAGFGISQPFVGIISDHMQRKLFILTALFIYFLSCFASAWTTSIDALYCYRIISSIAAACVSVVIKSILVDYFSGKMLAKANNYFMLGWSLTPMIAPVIGGYLQHFYDWQSNFYFMGLYGLWCFILCLLLLKKQQNKITLKKTLSFGNAIGKWKILFLDRVFLVCVLILAVENAIPFIYYTAAPFIIQLELHFNAAQYGEIMLFAGGSYVVGNILNGWLLNYFDVQKIIRGGLISAIVIIFTSLMMVEFFGNNHTSIYMVTIPIFLLFLCDAFVFPNVMAHALPRYSNFSGAAGGLLSGMLNIIAALIVAFCAHFFDLHHLNTLNLVYFVLLCFSLLIFISYKQNDVNAK